MFPSLSSRDLALESSHPLPRNFAAPMPSLRKRATHPSKGSPMSIQQLALVLDFAPKHWSSGLRLVAIALADHVGEDYDCWPSVTTLARRTGLSTRMVRAHIAELEIEGVISKETQYRDNRQTSNLYRWLWRVDNWSLGVKPTSGGRVKPTSGGDEAHFLQNPHITLIKKKEINP